MTTAKQRVFVAIERDENGVVIDATPVNFGMFSLNAAQLEAHVPEFRVRPVRRRSKWGKLRYILFGT